jgi:hypothetical protein
LENSAMMQARSTKPYERRRRPKNPRRKRKINRKRKRSRKKQEIEKNPKR